MCCTPVQRSQDEVLRHLEYMENIHKQRAGHGQGLSKKNTKHPTGEPDARWGDCQPSIQSDLDLCPAARLNE